MKLFFVNKVGEMEEKVKNYGWSRGEQSEKKVFEVLEELKAEGIIKESGRCDRFGREDSKGKDLAIITQEGKIIWLQVKSSFNETDKEKYLRRGIHYIAVGQKTSEQIKKEILRILKKKNKLAKPPRH